MQTIRRDLAPLLVETLREGDWVTVVAPQQRIWWTSRSTWEHGLLPRLLSRLVGRFVRYPFPVGPSEWTAMKVIEEGRGMPVGETQMVYLAARSRVHQTLAALNQVIERLRPARGRKSVLFFSDGFIRPHFEKQEFDRLVGLARRAHIVIEFVNPTGLLTGLSMAGPSSDRRGGRSPLMALDTDSGGSLFIAESTGGRASLSNDITALPEKALAGASAYYLLGYAPPSTEPGERRVRVRVRRKGLKVRARDRYFVASSSADAVPRSPLRLALESAVDSFDLPLAVSIRSDYPDTALLVDLGPLEVAPVRRLRVAAEAQPLAGGEPWGVATDEQTFDLTEPKRVVLDAPLARGTWQVRVAVEDTETGETGSVLHTFDVP
jgi:VWFA-related protein